MSGIPQLSSNAKNWSVYQGRQKHQAAFFFLGLPLRVFPALAASPGRVSRGTSQEYKHGELDRDHNAALNVFKRGAAGLGRPELTPEEMGPPRELTTVPASTVVEAGGPHPFTGGQFTTAYLPT